MKLMHDIELYEDETQEIDDADDGVEGLEVVESEVHWAVKERKRWKVSKSDGIMTEMLQVVKDMAIKSIAKIVNKVS